MFKITLLLSHLNIVLKGLKQLTFKGCRVWEVHEGRGITFNSNFCGCFIISSITYESYLFKINK
jgi:hypothetical protein